MVIYWYDLLEPVDKNSSYREASNPLDDKTCMLVLSGLVQPPKLPVGLPGTLAAGM